MPRLNSANRGDLFVHIAVDVPKKLTKRQRELLEEFAKESGEDDCRAQEPGAEAQRLAARVGGGRCRDTGSSSTAELPPTPAGRGRARCRCRPATCTTRSSVLRVRAGEELDVCRPSGRVWRVAVSTVRRPTAVTARRSARAARSDAAAAPKVTLVFGVSKGSKNDDIVEGAVEVGVAEVLPVLTARSIVKFDAEKRVERGERWRRVALAAAKQSKRAIRARVSATRSRCATPCRCSPTTTSCSSRGKRPPVTAQAIRDALAAAGALAPRLRASPSSSAPKAGLPPRRSRRSSAVGARGRHAGPDHLAHRDGGRRRSRARRPRARRSRERAVSEPVSGDAGLSRSRFARSAARSTGSRATRSRPTARQGRACSSRGRGRGHRRQHLHGHGRGRREGAQGGPPGAEGAARAGGRGDRLPCGARRRRHFARSASGSWSRRTRRLVAARVARAARARLDRSARAGSPSVRAGEGFRTRAMLKIEDGCDNFCTYCIVPYARGVPRGVAARRCGRGGGARSSRPGVREIVLTGINIGRYRDPETGADLADLVERGRGHRRRAASPLQHRAARPDRRAFSTCSLERQRCASTCTCRCRAAATRSSRRWAATYTAEQYAERIAAARAAIPGLAVTTDVIAGFPGETADAARRDARVRGAHGLREAARVPLQRASGHARRPRCRRLPPAVRAARAAELRGAGRRAARTATWTAASAARPRCSSRRVERRAARPARRATTCACELPAQRRRAGRDARCGARRAGDVLPG